MLYVIETSGGGAVKSAVACDNGIDQAIEVIANALTKPEEDWTVACDVVTERWRDACDAHGAEAEQYFSIYRSSTSRFGLVSIP